MPLDKYLGLEKVKGIGPSQEFTEEKLRLGMMPIGPLKLGKIVKSEKDIETWMKSLKGEGQKLLKKDFHTKFISNMKDILRKQK